MTHTSTEQPEALRLADALRDGQYSLYQERAATEAELRRLHALVQELEASQAQRVPLTDEAIESLSIWQFFVGLWPQSRQEITRAIEAAHGITQEKQG